MKFKKKPVVIEAIQWDGSQESRINIQETFPDIKTARLKSNPEYEIIEWSIKTLEGSHIVSKYDWIIKGVKGEYYPCKPDIFEMTYDKED